MAAPAVINIHTPTSSFAIVHSLNQENIHILFNKLTRKVNVEPSSTTYKNVGPGWIKYEFNGSIWNLDDESDYSIFAWRCEQRQQHSQLQGQQRATDGPPPPPLAASSHQDNTPTLHLHDPTSPLPTHAEYQNPVYYLAKHHHSRKGDRHHRKSEGHARNVHDTGAEPGHMNGDHDATISIHPVHSDRGINNGVAMSVVSASETKSGKARSRASVAGSESSRWKAKTGAGNRNEEPEFKKAFEKFHSENGVRTVIGSIGHVQNVRMLLKSSHRHVYVSRKFATKHGFIPKDALPGYYGYEGLVNIGSWPITVQSIPEDPDTAAERLAVYFNSLRTMTGTPALTAPPAITTANASPTRPYTPSLYKSQVGSQSQVQLYLPTNPSVQNTGLAHPASASNSGLPATLNPDASSTHTHTHAHAHGAGQVRRRVSTKSKSPLASIIQPQHTGASGLRRAHSTRSTSTGSSFYLPHSESEGGTPTPKAHHYHLNRHSHPNWPSNSTPSHTHNAANTALAPAPSASRAPSAPASVAAPHSRPRTPSPTHTHHPSIKPKPVTLAIYLSEEPHFDVVLGRAFFDKRQIKTNVADPTDVVCLDTGERLECELVVLKDGKGEIVTVT